MMYLHIHNLSHTYALTEVLLHVNLQLQAGQTLALVGPSGCGKSTLLHCVAGLLRPSQGRIISTFGTLGCVFQQPRLLPWKHVLDNIGLGLKAQRVPAKLRRQQSEALALQLGLHQTDWAKFPFELSGGMQSRVALARALVTVPDLLLLDEPFSALDIGLKTELYQVLRQQVQQQQTAVLMITHDLMEAVVLADHIAVISPTPGQVLRIFTLKTAPNQRDEAWVYRHTAELMQAIEVRYSFGLPGGKDYVIPNISASPEGCRV